MLFYLKLNTIRFSHLENLSISSSLECCSYPCTLHPETDGLLQKSCLSRVKKLEMIAFKCTDLQSKESAMIGDGFWQGEMSNPARACPPLSLFVGAALHSRSLSHEWTSADGVSVTDIWLILESSSVNLTALTLCLTS